MQPCVSDRCTQNPSLARGESCTAGRSPSDHAFVEIDRRQRELHLAAARDTAAVAPRADLRTFGHCFDDRARSKSARHRIVRFCRPERFVLRPSRARSRVGANMTTMSGIAAIFTAVQTRTVSWARALLHWESMLRFLLMVAVVGACGSVDTNIEDQITIEQGVYGLLISAATRRAAKINPRPAKRSSPSTRWRERTVLASEERRRWRLSDGPRRR